MEWKEEEHPRDEDGKFTDGQGGSREAKSYKQNTSYSEILAMDSIQLPDEMLPRSVGAKWSNYEIELANGEKAKLLEGSKLHHKEVLQVKEQKLQYVKLIDSLRNMAERLKIGRR